VNNNTSAHKIKVCTKCNLSLPATKEYFYSQKNGLYGLYATCKKCKTEQAKNNYKWENVKRYVLTCKWCNKEFKADNKKRKFCSKDCQTEWQRNSQEYRDLHKGKCNQYGETSEREKVYADKFNEFYKGKFVYYSEFKDIDSKIKTECLSCGYVQERHAQCLRKKKNIKCDQCIKQKNNDSQYVR
jgi:hypothetical protein